MNSRKSKSSVDYRLYLVTDRDILGERDLLSSIEEAILGGVTVVQLREKAATSREFYLIAQKVKMVTDKYNISLIINDRLDIALAVDAAGLHVGQRD
ncbi:MAG: thiamine phosphate synthase, partial [Clostridia bacterium]|nr:thiamine phosphate synthase [Clostridia bacterium]